MGAWGTGPFDNDDAATLMDRAAKRGAAAIRAIIRAVNEHPKKVIIESDSAAECVAACALLALSRGAVLDGVREEVHELVASLRARWTNKDVAFALSALNRVERSSELTELWKGHDGRKWHLEVEKLRRIIEEPLAARHVKRAVKLSRPQLAAGDVYLVELTPNRRMFAKVIFVSLEFKRMICIGLRKVNSDVDLTTNAHPSIHVLYTVDIVVQRHGWSKLKTEGVSKAELDITLRRIGQYVYLADQQLRAATPEDRNSIPIMLMHSPQSFDEEATKLLW